MWRHGNGIKTPMSLQRAEEETSMPDIAATAGDLTGVCRGGFLARLVRRGAGGGSDHPHSPASDRFHFRLHCLDRSDKTISVAWQCCYKPWILASIPNASRSFFTAVLMLCSKSTKVSVGQVSAGSLPDSPPHRAARSARPGTGRRGAAARRWDDRGSHLAGIEDRLPNYVPGVARMGLGLGWRGSTSIWF